ncbi:MOSC domain-containing protein [Nocardia flavorosea]|uniref:MOSC domain-containing protein n=1 Tax=Nocardia flavorosea TaxID=53429 RepID=UPI001896199E|nr:MOSC domain-containing protein [Nocardia flavorosea]MBF6349619.1 MOSC domain-containing protein [Nocardia flavorosea]
MRVGDIGRVLAVCVVHAELTVPGRVGRSAIDKRPVTERVRAQRLGLDGDHVCNTRDHGGVHQAVYGYADDDAANWSAELGRELPVGWFGENLRIAGLPLSDAVVGARCTVGDAVLEVSGPRVPCATFGHWAGEPQWVRRFTHRANTGCYFRVVTEGSVGAGDAVEVVHVPDHGVTVRDVFTGADPRRLELLLDAEPTVSDVLRAQIARHAKWRAAGPGTAAVTSGSAMPAAATAAESASTITLPSGEIEATA